MDLLDDSGCPVDLRSPLLVYWFVVRASALFRYWLLVVGYWLLVIGCWLLVTFPYCNDYSLIPTPKGQAQGITPTTYSLLSLVVISSLCYSCSVLSSVH